MAERFIRYLTGRLTISVPRDHKIAGVSFVPLYINTLNKQLFGKTCILVGKETSGLYFNKYNFFGGKLMGSPPMSNKQRILLTLWNEVYEELGLILQPELFLKSLLDIIIVPFQNDSVSILFVCHIHSIPVAFINKELSARLNSDLEDRFKEISQVYDLQLEEQQNDISDYVKTCIPLVKKSVSKMSINNNIHIQEFM
jgi:8-oxo-dGTP pyrophosphatase MutT (NUDIX family)